MISAPTVKSQHAPSTTKTRPVDHVAELVRPIQDELEDRWLEETDRLDAICRYALLPAGKLFRPALLVESALAVGGVLEQVLPAAIGTEYGHTASLVHDDIIDGDSMRRGRPSTYHKFGTDNAIVAADALIFHLFLCLAECRGRGVPAERVVTALEIASASGIALCKGQSLEAEITENSIRDVATYLRMIDGKTAALFRSSCQCGSVLGGGSDEQVEALGRYGTHLGLAFQIIDDLFAFTGDSETIGKQTTSDVRNRRLTLPILLAYQSGDAQDVRELDMVFEGGLVPEKALAMVSDVLVSTGALTAARKMAWEHATSAQDALATLPPSAHRERLHWFAAHAVERVS
ncbi:polyprenyl synthetase family protein [Amycolatopsis sp. NPDC059657]|uniref:polyprenyl synthetase family protein n=1 Tax=Amycolatopsis sp. NPDC059657 TaxID=3346899 RepID=UPI00366E4E11